MKTFDEIILNNELGNVTAVAEQVYKKRGVVGSSLEAYKLGAAVLNLIFDKKFSEAELNEIITDSIDDEDIDAIYVEKNTLSIFDFKEKLSTTKIKQEISAFKESIELHVFNEPEDYSTITNLVLRNQL